VLFLADESFDFGAVRTLREEGYDVKAIAEESPGIPDVQVAALAATEERVLLTEDKDFGQLVYASGVASSGVIFVRFPGNARSELLSNVVGIIRRLGEDLKGCFVVIQPGRIRVSRLQPE
jgi:predicted nuclease of predicted toxin-antitoxin system